MDKIQGDCFDSVTLFFIYLGCCCTTQKFYVFKEYVGKVSWGNNKLFLHLLEAICIVMAA